MNIPGYKEPIEDYCHHWPSSRRDPGDARHHGPAQNVRAISWAIDGTALVVAASLLALIFFCKGYDCVAAGFLVFAIGEAVMLGGMASSLQASVPSFAAGTALWTASLLLTSVPKEFIIWTRIQV
jgi:hypothetical protein